MGTRQTPKDFLCPNLEWEQNNIPVFPSVPEKRKDGLHTSREFAEGKSELSRGLEN